MPTKKDRKGSRSKEEMIAWRNKSIVRTYLYWYEEKRLRNDDVMDKLTDAFFVSEDYIYYNILKRTSLTDEEKITIKPIIRIN